MKKKLPKVFANNITKTIDNNEKIYTSINQNNQTETLEKYKTTEKKEKETSIQKQMIQQPTKKKINQTKKPSETIMQKINKIINTKEYIYKIPVKITTNKKEITTKIIGKNNKNIITIENELIKIEDIINIEPYEDK